MARNTPPAGNEIAEQALRLRFEDSKTVDATRAKDNVHVRFTPTRFEEPKKREELEAGIVLGRVQLEVGQYHGIYKAKLRSGKYHLFLAKVGEAWKGYAEFNGGIALEAKAVKVEEGSSLADIREMPTVEFGSICFEFCIVVIVPVPIPIPPYEIPVPIPWCWTWCL